MERSRRPRRWPPLSTLKFWTVATEIDKILIKKDFQRLTRDGSKLQEWHPKLRTNLIPSFSNPCLENFVQINRSTSDVWRITTVTNRRFFRGIWLLDYGFNFCVSLKIVQTRFDSGIFSRRIISFSLVLLTLRHPVYNYIIIYVAVYLYNNIIIYKLLLYNYIVIYENVQNIESRVYFL